jgi:formylglycine-generating enzyme required for sulfatase activity
VLVPTNPAPPGMVLIPAGSFVMGNCMDPSEGWSNELPLHTNTLSAFYMDTNEVSKAQWDEVYQWSITNGYSFENAGVGKATNHPVHTLSWFDVVKWCNARSEKEGLTPAYYTSAAQTNVYRTGQTDVQNDWVKWNTGYRLPTEAEWEKAARGGASGHRFPWSDVDTISHSQANYRVITSNGTNYFTCDVSPTPGFHPAYTNNGTPYTSPVGSFAPNGYGLYDMAGNVWESCWDWYDDMYYSSSPETDPRGPASSPSGERVLRGGSWYFSAINARCTYRLYSPPDGAGFDAGFRCVRGL